MIVITGPGRSGTSLLAKLYGELGFDTGGRWYPWVSAGLEDSEVVAVNLKVARAMGVSVEERDGGRALRALSVPVRLSDGRVPPRFRRPFVRSVDYLRYLRSAPNLMNWSSVDGVAQRYGEQLRAMAKERAVVKDPRFCFTLRAWLAAGAPIEAVVFSIRPLDAMVDSRVRAGMYRDHARNWAKHNYVYGSGLLLTAAAQYRLPVTSLRFPDFLDNPDALYDALPLPEPRTREQFRAAFDAVYDPEFVHDGR